MALDKYEDIEAQYNEQVATQNTVIKHPFMAPAVSLVR